MTSAGVERKATCQALFRKILYLTEHEPLLDPEAEGAKDLSLQEVTSRPQRFSLISFRSY